ncbi:putative 1,3-beta-glucan synthase [Helianthus anomalus]
MLIKAWKEGRLFQRLSSQETLNWLQIRRLHSLFNIKDSAVNVPRNLDARRRLEFLTNSLFMNMPRPKPIRAFTPYYSETVPYSINELLKKTEDGISILFYLQKIYPGILAFMFNEQQGYYFFIFMKRCKIIWIFQTNGKAFLLKLAAMKIHTIRGMMYYRKALMLQPYLERMTVGGFSLLLSRIFLLLLDVRLKNITTRGNAHTLPLEVVQNLLSSTSVAARLLVTMVSSYVVVTI